MNNTYTMMNNMYSKHHNSSSKRSNEFQQTEQYNHRSKMPRTSHHSNTSTMVYSTNTDSKSGVYQEYVEVVDEEPRFTFDEVKEMIEKLLSKQTRASAAVSAGMKKVNFEEIVVGNHTVQGCKELIEQLVQSTRRVRTLQEVLNDIKDNLNKRQYTEIIHKATLKGDLPKKPPSAYLLYHQDRYNELREENSLAVEVSKIVAEEWKTLSDKKRKEYQKRHDELVRKYERDMQQLGLVDEAAPKRPKSAKTLFIEEHMNPMETAHWTKEQIALRKEQLVDFWDKLSAEQKSKWVNMHKQNTEMYLREKEEYEASHPHLNHSRPEKKPRLSTKIKQPVAPKSAMKFFIAKKIPEGLTGEAYDEAKKRLKEKFYRLRDKKLLKYVKKAIQDKERYDTEVQEFMQKYPDREIVKTKPNITKDQWKLYAKVIENRPNMPAPTAYLHYCGKILTDMNDNDDEQVPTKRMQTASMSWKGISERERKMIENEHLLDVERYVHEMEVWLYSQPEERRRQILSEDPKVNPDYWRKKLNRMKKAIAKTNSRQMF